MPRRILAVDIPGPAGRLEALLEEPEPGAARESALVCHPHPLYGGTMHNKVVYRLARGLRHAGAAVLRFNFRGVGRSEGQHGNLAGGVEDAHAALAWLRQRYPDIPYTLAGFSFGSRVVARMSCDPPRARRLILLGYPTRGESPDALLTCAVPRVFVQSTHDEFGPVPELTAFFDDLSGPKKLIWVDASDHFFSGALDFLERVVCTLE